MPSEVMDQKSKGQNIKAHVKLFVPCQSWKHVTKEVSATCGEAKLRTRRYLLQNYKCVVSHVWFEIWREGNVLIEKSVS